MNIIGEVKGKNCIIVDDIIDSGGTIVNAVEALKKAGAIDVYVFITHAVLSGDAAKKIQNSKIKKLIITDTIDNSLKIKNNSKIEVILPLMITTHAPNKENNIPKNLIEFSLSLNKT